MEGFMIDLKTFLGLAMTPKVSESKYQAGFGVIILGQNPLTFMILIYSTTVLYCTIWYLIKYTPKARLFNYVSSDQSY